MKVNISTRLMVTLLAVVIVTWLYPRMSNNHFIYQERQPWNYNKLIAPFDIPIPRDSARIADLTDSLHIAMGPVFVRNNKQIDEIEGELRGKLDDLNMMQMSRTLRQCYSNGVVDEMTWRRIEKGTLDSIRLFDGRKIRTVSTQKFTTPSRIYQQLDTLARQEGYDKVFKKLALNKILLPNIVEDEALTSQNIENILPRLLPPLDTILKGQTIIDRGTIISHNDYRNIQAYEDLARVLSKADSRTTWLVILGQFVYVLIIFAVLVGYLWEFEMDIIKRLQSYLFVLLEVVLFFALAVMMNHFVGDGMYIVPFTIISILTLVFFNARTAIMCQTVVVLLCAGFSSFTLEFIMLEFAAAAASVYSLEQLRRRSQLLRTAVIVAVAYFVTYCAVQFMMNGSVEGFSWTKVAFLMTSAVLTSFAYVLMFVFEKIFGFTSVVTLVELTDITNPLLRELSNECPGTFQHSMTVSNLAYDAAQKVGADTTLIRAGALYHDIGKLSNPAFFTENQGGVNPHSSLPPETSAEIIINHVYDGLRRADKAKLPKVIKDFIREHHGAGKAKYFYYTYCQQHPNETVDASTFTYPGPNPQTRESSILMMADAVEAASRSLKEYTPETLTDLVNKIVDGQIAEGLHNDSNISFRDVQLIKESFIKRLKTLYHARIAYPEAPKNAN